MYESYLILQQYPMTQLIGKLQKWLPRRKFDIFGKDSLMNSSLPYYTLSLLLAIGLFSKNANPFMFLSIGYSLFPILDQLFSLDERNPNEEERRKLQQNDAYFRMAVYSAMILSWAATVKLLIRSSNLQIGWSNMINAAALIFIASNRYAVQFSVSHQVMHKPGKFYRVLATLHMVKLYYPHFTYHHLEKHHELVATPLDPSTSLKGQTVYQFIRRCVVDSWMGVYQQEKRLGKGLFTNYAVLSIFSTIGFGVLIYCIFGLQATILHSIMAIGSIVYLQAVNYIEHYGLLRKKLPNGQFEKTTILHSWNAPHRFTNYLFFKLQRHSDHHQNSSKPYQTLVSMDQSPFLPHGYNLMILMSFFPKTWFRIMDPLVQAYSKLDIQKKEKVDPIAKQTATVETRKFLIEVALSAFLLFMLSIFKII